MANNYPIQGTGALMTKLAAILFNRSIEAKSLDAFIVNMVHDEIVVEAKKEDAEAVYEILISSMKLAGGYFIKSLPIEVEGKVTEFWDH